MAHKDLISIENTRFIFSTNFSGDPSRDEKYHSSTRKGNIVIPTYEQAMDLMDAGFNVKQTKPRENDDPTTFEPTYYISAVCNMSSEWPPKIYLVSGDAEPVLLDAESLGVIDKVYVRNVNVILNPYYNENVNRWSLYVKTMYVEQDLEDDPFAARYRRSMVD